MWIYDVDVVRSDAMKNPRNPRVCCDLRALLETHWGLLSLQEYRGEMWIGDVDVVHSDAMKNQRNPRVSGDQGGLLETHWGHLSAQEHQGEMRICDVDVVHSDAMKIKETREYLVIWGVFRRRIGAFFCPRTQRRDVDL